MKFLLIDDLSLQGWKSILEKAIIKGTGVLDFAIDFEGAMAKLKTKYDIIFLDVRLEEKDHYVNDIEEYTGYKILKRIKKSFDEINFSTPIILLTATNKIWNIDQFREYGVDSFFIKEHPDFIFSKEASRFNLEKLQTDFAILIKESHKRNEVWTICNSIIDKLNNHKYFKDQNHKYQNIKQRIIDKLKLGYSELFKKKSKLENELLLSNNEALSFIIFWSILEEITKGFTDFNETWDDKFNRKPSWKFRNKEFFIEYNQKVNSYKINFKQEDPLIGDKIYASLSEQVYALIFAYVQKSEVSNFNKAFKEINTFRNEVDYIHSSLNSIFTKELITEKKKDKSFQMNIKVLNFITNILKLEI